MTTANIINTIDRMMQDLAAIRLQVLEMEREREVVVEEQQEQEQVAEPVVKKETNNNKKYFAPKPVRDKDWVQFGVKHAGQVQEHSSYHGVEGEYITISGRKYTDDIITNTFKIGDSVIYDRYNYAYIGTIVKITEKTVTIRPQYEEKNIRHDIAKFFWYNLGLDLEKEQETRNNWYD